MLLVSVGSPSLGIGTNFPLCGKLFIDTLNMCVIISGIAENASMMIRDERWSIADDLVLSRGGSRNSSRGGVLGRNFSRGGGLVRVQVRRNFHILTSKKLKIFN